MQECDFKIDDPIVKEEVRKAFSSCGQTCIVENAFNRERGAEVLQNFNKRMSAWRRWGVLVVKKIAGQVIHFQELNFSSTAIPRGIATKQVGALLHPPTKGLSLNFRPLCLHPKQLLGIPRPGTTELQMQQIAHFCWKRMPTMHGRSWSKVGLVVC